MVEEDDPPGSKPYLHRSVPCHTSTKGIGSSALATDGPMVEPSLQDLQCLRSPSPTKAKRSSSKKDVSLFVDTIDLPLEGNR